MRVWNPDGQQSSFWSSICKQWTLGKPLSCFHLCRFLGTSQTRHEAVPKRIWVQDFFPNCCIFFIDSVFCCCRCYKSPCFLRGSLYSQIARRLGVSRLCAMWETWVRSLGWEDPLEEGMATHFSVLAWRIPYGEEPGGLQSMGSQRVRHNWAIKNSAAQTMGIRLKDQSQPFSRTKMKFLCSTVNTSQHRNDCLTLTVLEPENISSSTTLRKLKSYTHLRERLPRTVMRRTLTMGHIGRHDFFLQLTLSVSCQQTLTYSSVTGRKVLNFLRVFVCRRGWCTHPSPLPSRSEVLVGVPGTLFTRVMGTGVISDRTSAVVYGHTRRNLHIFLKAWKFSAQRFGWDGKNQRWENIYHTLFSKSEVYKTVYTIIIFL